MIPADIDHTAIRLARSINEILVIDPEAAWIVLGSRALLDMGEYPDTAEVRRVVEGRDDLPEGDTSLTALDFMNFILRQHNSTIELQLLPAKCGFNNEAVPQVVLLRRTPFCPFLPADTPWRSLQTVMTLTTGITLASVVDQLVPQMTTGQLESFIEELLKRSGDSRLCKRIAMAAKGASSSRRAPK